MSVYRTIGPLVYLAIKHNRKPDSEIWFKGQPLGENSSRAMIKNMAMKAELPSRFVSEPVGNPEDRFSRVAAHLFM